MDQDINAQDDLLAILEEGRDLFIERPRCEERLIHYARYVWPVVEPARPFVGGYVLESIAVHLEAVTFGHIKRLLINVPPGFTKSLMTNVFWPSWEWGPRNMPSMRYICAAYAQPLTIRDNTRCRNIVMSDRYRRFWGHRFAIDKESVIKFGNNQTGWKFATSVTGIGTGERGDRFIIDDPNNPLESESETVRETTKLWFTEVVPDRLNDQAESAIVIIQQRVHEEDVSGIALTRDMGYTHLMIPMEYVPRRYVNAYTTEGIIESFFDDDVDLVDPENVFWEDHRYDEGELAWPERISAKAYEQLKKDKTDYAIASQYQQSPEPRGGAILKRHYWQDWQEDHWPPFETVLASLDCAFTEDTDNDPSAMTIWGLFRDINGHPQVMLMYSWAEYLEFHALVKKVYDICTKGDGRIIDTPVRFAVDQLLIENKASGISVKQELARLLQTNPRFGVDLIDPKKGGDKVARANSVEYMFQQGMVWAPTSRKFASDVIDQCAIFPRGAHDDLVDTVTQLLRYLRDRNFLVTKQETLVERFGAAQYRSRPQPLYPGMRAW